MLIPRAPTALALAMLAAVPARAAEAAPAHGALGLGIQLATGFLILLAALIALSVVAKLLIVFGIVPRQPATATQALVHTLANFVGGLTRPRPRGDPRRDDR